VKKKALKNALLRITTMYLDKSDKADQYFQECSDIDCENIEIKRELERLQKTKERGDLTDAELYEIRKLFGDLASSHELNLGRNYLYEYVDPKTQKAFEFFNHGVNAILSIRP